MQSTHTELKLNNAIKLWIYLEWIRKNKQECEISVNPDLTMHCKKQISRKWIMWKITSKISIPLTLKHNTMQCIIQNMGKIPVKNQYRKWLYQHSRPTLQIFLECITLKVAFPQICSAECFIQLHLSDVICMESLFLSNHPLILWGRLPFRAQGKRKPTE